MFLSGRPVSRFRAGAETPVSQPSSFLGASDIKEMDQEAVAAGHAHLQPLPKSCFTFEQIKMQPVKSPDGEMFGLLEDVYFVWTGA